MIIDKSSWNVVNFDDIDLSIIRHYAKNAEIGGKSQIRTIDRMENLESDQFIAQLGEAALSVLLTGSIARYSKTRYLRDLNKYNGDGGTDLIGLNVDIKTSRAKYGLDYLYHLWIREREYHPDIYYYLGLIEPNNFKVVYIIGWILGKNIKTKDGNRYEVRMDYLNFGKHEN